MSALAAFISLLLVSAAKMGGAYEVKPAPDAPAALLAGQADAWRGASAIAWGPQAYETVFRALWSEAGLFIRFDAKDPAPWSAKIDRDSDLWREEVVEIFLDADMAGSRYIELDVNPAGIVCDARVNAAARSFDASWDIDGLEARTRINRRRGGVVAGWTTTAFIPWRALAAAADAGVAPVPTPGARWRFNIFRIERPHGPQAPEKGALLLAWSPTGAATFHKPQAFRELVLVAPSASE